MQNIIYMDELSSWDYHYKIKIMFTLKDGVPEKRNVFFIYLVIMLKKQNKGQNVRLNHLTHYPFVYDIVAFIDTIRALIFLEL